MHKISSAFTTMVDIFDLITAQTGKNRLPRYLFLGLCFNLAIAPVVYAATGDEITRKTAYAIGILGLVTLSLSIYLFVVIFQPERF